jgi:hypothetical protein
VYNPKKLLGVTTLDVVRANTFVAQVSKLTGLQVWCSTSRQAIACNILHRLIVTCALGCSVLLASVCCMVLHAVRLPMVVAYIRANPIMAHGHITRVLRLCAACTLFVLQNKGLDLKEVDVPVVGGHAGITILPLLSQVGMHQRTHLNAHLSCKTDMQCSCSSPMLACAACQWFCVPISWSPSIHTRC